MRFCTLASGSKANATLVEIGETRLLVDNGLGPRILAKRLAEAGVVPQSISAIVVTHEHIDHVKGIAQAVAKWHWPVFSTRGTLNGMRDLGLFLSFVRSRAHRKRCPPQTHAGAGA